MSTCLNSKVLESDISIENKVICRIETQETNVIDKEIIETNLIDKELIETSVIDKEIIDNNDNNVNINQIKDNDKIDKILDSSIESIDKDKNVEIQKDDEGSFIAYWDISSRKYYYHNQLTNVTQWLVIIYL
jgi:hypothetical protein